ncbi:hypothetical protein C943_04396 [Mariniradius saccharolyticus AK6]|uniref:Uncharacterized protein n=1 Tax=Mariniradius saccharolyticus AK6 TaxID=1239962 RepID=M7XG43_9BACT|nr:hypothetical protein C943_04396 [Mariniradius saccharolyticus AK6]
MYDLMCRRAFQGLGQASIGVGKEKLWFCRVILPGIGFSL